MFKLTIEFEEHKGGVSLKSTPDHSNNPTKAEQEVAARAMFAVNTFMVTVMGAIDLSPKQQDKN